MTALGGCGISIDLPAGWEGRISLREPARAAAESCALLHAANFALPGSMGDFGAGAVETMGARDLLLILLEYERSSASMPMFAQRGVPRLQASDFSRVALQRVLEGQGGTQRFFNEAGRAMCLYVVLGSHLRRLRTVPLVNDVLSTIVIV